MKEYPVQRAAVLKEKPDPSTLVFGRTFTDHMFIMDYTAGQGWHDGRIVPYGPIALDPSAMVFHYAQEVFEGLKAYRSPDGGVQLFRPTENVKRINSSCERMCIPPLDEEDALAAIEQLVRLEADWVPSAPGTSLYIRPFIIATTPTLGVHAAHNYIFAIITCQPGEDLCGERGRPGGPGRHRLYQVRRQLRRLHPGRRAGGRKRLRPGAVAGRRPPQVY